MSSFSDAVLSHASLRAYYRLGEAAGTTLSDIGPNALNGTYAASGVTYGVTGAIIGDPSTAVTFDGTSDPATVPDNNALDLADVFSIEFWVKRSATQGAAQNILNKSTAAYQVQFTTGNNLQLFKTGTSGMVVGGGQITDQLWHHVVITKNGTTRSCWVDGADQTSLGTNQTLADNTTLLRIGHFGVGTNRFPGSVDELALYSAVLSPTEVLEHYNLGVKNYLYTTQTFTADGTFIPPAGVERVHVECRGAGGAGGTSTVNAGGGGGAGAFAKSRSITVVPGNSYAVVVGQGGTGAGPDSTFNSTTVIAKGGGVGGNGSAGGAGTAGVGGTAAASTGQIKKSGGNGAAGTGAITGGGGGGGAGDNSPGGNASGGTAGAAGVVGGGAGGAGAGVPAAGAGNAPGGGGGGATVTGARGNGARGVVAVSFVEVGVNITAAAITQSEAIADTPGDLASVAVLAAAEALAQTDILSTVAFLEGLEALADVGSAVTIAVFTANWQRISPGLSGTVYDSTGSTPVVGAQVLVFRDDTNALIATLASDAQGEWALDLDPAFQYWVSGWKTGSPQVEDRTDRAIVPVETVVEVGT